MRSSSATGLSSSGGTASSSAATSGAASGSAPDHEWAYWVAAHQGAAWIAPEDNTRYDTQLVGVVTDLVTGLMWQSQTASGLTWSGAEAHCAAPAAGHSDWRLPTLIELAALVDYSRFNPAINTAVFLSTPADNHWASTPGTAPVIPGQPQHFNVHFYSGFATYAGDENLFSVRCVRSTP